MSNQDQPAKAITLVKPHRHAGRDYPVGAPLELPESKVQWLTGLGVAVAGVPAAASTTDTTTTTEA